MSSRSDPAGTPTRSGERSHSRDEVALAACGSYDRELVEKRVERVFDLLGGPEAIVRPGESVFVKVNLIVPFDPSRAVTTHPEVVRAVVRQLQRVTDRVTIGESPGGPYNKSVLRNSFEHTGMAAVAGETGAELNFDTREVLTPAPSGMKMKELVLCAPVVEADRVVSVSKLKTHVLTGLTAAVKNHYGCVPGMQKFTYHSRYTDAREFSDVIVDVAVTVDSDLSIVDGVWGMEGNGSVWGVPRKMGFLAGGRDPFAVDCAVGQVLGLKNTLNLPLGAAIERGVFHGDASRLVMLGDDPAGLRVRGLKLGTKRSIIGWLPAPFLVSYSAMFHMRPYIDAKTCEGCGKCVEICPGGAIALADGAARVEGSKCIRCYCCYELCESGGVRLERPARNLLRLSR